jgi:hypothetical protein
MPAVPIARESARLSGAVRERGIVMVKLARRMLLAIAALAHMGLNSVAYDESGSAGQPPATPAASEDKLGDPEILPGGSLFNDDGWQSGAVCACGDRTCFERESPCSSSCDDEANGRRISADVEFMALRTHFSEQVVGKLGERYELSERITVGVERPTGIGGRIRYWSYDRTTPNLSGGSSLRADFDVVDFEGTVHFGTPNFDLLLTSGVRWADIKIDIDAGRCRNDMPGGSFGLDLRGLICNDCENGLVWRSVSGARFSIFGGDWELSDGLIGATRDDNLTVVEIYGGVECTGFYHGHEVYTRLVFESQNWRSDALGAATGIDSMSFIGPGLNLGVHY